MGYMNLDRKVISIREDGNDPLTNHPLTSCYDFVAPSHDMVASGHGIMAPGHTMEAPEHIIAFPG